MCSAEKPSAIFRLRASVIVRIRVRVSVRVRLRWWTEKIGRVKYILSVHWTENKT